MGSSNRACFYITILCLEYIVSSGAFVINNKRSSSLIGGGRHYSARNEGTHNSKLAQALNMIQTQKRQMDEDQNDNYGLFQQQRGDWGYPYGEMKEENDPVYNTVDDSDDGYTDYYGGGGVKDDEKYNPESLAKMLEYYYDAGYPDEAAAVNENLAPEASNVHEADEKEIEDILNANEERPKHKKNFNWTPQALGFAGLKRKRGDTADITDNETTNESTDPEIIVNGEADANKAVASEEDDEEDTVESEGAVGVQANLSDDQVKQLLSDANDAEVKSITKEVNLENINGKQTVSADQIVDILKDDEEGNPKEMLIETKVPEQNPSSHLNKELLVQNLPAESAPSVIHKRAGNMFDFLQPDEVEQPQLDKEEEAELEAEAQEGSILSEEELLKECLLQYIKLEDRENTALAEALNWATMAQFEQTDTYIPMQIQYLRNAVDNEQTLVELRRRCFGLAEEVDADEQAQADDEDESSMNEVEKRGYSEDQVGFPFEELGPMVDENSDLYEEEQPFLTDELDDGGELEDDEYIPDEEELQQAYEISEDPIVNSANTIYSQLTDEEIAQYIAEELKKLLRRKGIQFRDPSLEQVDDEESDRGQWFENSVDDEGETILEDEDGAKDYHINPFLRELIETYRKEKLGLDKRSNINTDANAYDYGDDFTQDTEDYYDPAEEEQEEVCAAVVDYTDDCALADMLGWKLDNEAIELCNRHQLCYTCGATHGIQQTTCDRGFLSEAYLLCQNQVNEDDCVAQADLLLELMFKSHQSLFFSEAPQECQSECTLDYVTTGNPSLKKKK